MIMKLVPQFGTGPVVSPFEVEHANGRFDLSHAEIRSELGLPSSADIEVTTGSTADEVHVRISRKDRPAVQNNGDTETLLQEISFLRSEVLRLGGNLKPMSNQASTSASQTSPTSQPTTTVTKLEPPFESKFFGMLPDVTLVGLGSGELLKLSELIASRVAVLDFWTTK
jgi:hypothetical protein